MTHLQPGALLQGGKYRIEKFLGQGGFGITYLGWHVSLNSRVAVKEFFMKDHCDRNPGTHQVTMGTSGSRELVLRFREKFIKEARHIYALSHPHIVRVIDVFEENGTAYYVLDYLGGGTLRYAVQAHGALSVSVASGYIRQVASALDYIHGRNLLHLDVKPSNIMLNDSGEAILVDFGVSKRYDESGHQTSSTPLGVSEGYAPIEQYESGGMDQFSPSTDIYSLGATFYYLLTGSRPPKASALLSESLSFPDGIPEGIRACIVRSMAPGRKDRPQNVGEFLRLLETAVGGSGRKSVKDEETVSDAVVVKPEVLKPETVSDSGKVSVSGTMSLRKWLVSVIICLLAGLGVYLFFGGKTDNSGALKDTLAVFSDTLSVDSIVNDNDTLALVEESSQTDVSSSVSSEPSMCSFYVTTSPSGALVTIDGKSYGKSPLSDVQVPVGNHVVRLTLSGYESFSHKIHFGDRPVVLNEVLRAESSDTFSLSSSSSNKIESSSMSSGTGRINGHDYVDLGLSVKWATCNVGASCPEDYGNYYAWGEIQTKSEYTKENSLTYGKDIGNISGNSRYDVARAQWGSSWRLPTLAEIQELKDKCKWEWTTVGGHKGYRVTGPNGNSIFLPAAGYRYGTSVDDQGSYGYYWSGTLGEGDKYGAYCLYFYYGIAGWGINSRYFGHSVRPVSE